MNSLRNVALRHANTSHIFLLDFDFLPSMGLYAYLRESIKTFMNSGQQVKRAALVVPAFETLQYKMIFPESKMELLQRLNMGEVLPFRKEVWKAGHDATDYTRWKLATRPGPSAKRVRRSMRALLESSSAATQRSSPRNTSTRSQGRCSCPRRE